MSMTFEIADRVLLVVVLTQVTLPHVRLAFDLTPKGEDQNPQAHQAQEHRPENTRECNDGKVSRLPPLFEFYHEKKGESS